MSNSSSSYQVASYRTYKDTVQILEKLGTNENPIDSGLKNTLSYLQNTESSPVNNVTNYKITPYIIKSGNDYIQKYRVENKVGDFTLYGDLCEYDENNNGEAEYTKEPSLITNDFINGYVIIDGKLYTHNCELLMIESIFSFTYTTPGEKDTHLIIPFKKATGTITNLGMAIKYVKATSTWSGYRIFDIETKEILKLNEPGFSPSMTITSTLINCVLVTDEAYVLIYGSEIENTSTGEVVQNLKLIYPISYFK